jgi:AcrR family transcriptional regulator
MRATGRAVGRYGPAGLTLAAVAAEAGLSAAALVKRFGSKRALLLAFAAQAVDAVDPVFDRARAAHGTALAALHAALAELVQDVGSVAEFANHLGLLQLDLADPEFRAHAAAHARRLRERILALLTDAVAAGELAGADPGRLARAVQLTYNGVLILWAVDPERPLPDTLRADVDALLDPHRSGS